MTFPNGYDAAGHPVPGPSDRSYRPSAGPAPDCWLPRSVKGRRDHLPSFVLFTVRLPDVPAAFGGPARRRFRQTARVECGCGWGFGRTRVRDRRWADDVALRGQHAAHVWRVGRTATERQAA